MTGLSIGEVAERIGLRPSALRYYEQVGLLPPPLRRSGQRRYDPGVLNRLAVIAQARRAGFTIAETRRLVAGFPADVPASRRWLDLAREKERELDALVDRINDMRRAVRAARQCTCDTLDECGRRLRRHS
jgi:MerR family redox-sensitive transcriptional activator SoxR